MDQETSDQVILFFDGYCGLCSRSVDFLIKRDHRRRILYSPLQGETAKSLLSDHDRLDLDSVVLITTRPSSASSPCGTYRKSDAILRALSMLGGAYAPVWAVGRVFPRFFRDAVYDFVARNRFRLFGQRDSCRVPGPDERKLFLP